MIDLAILSAVLEGYKAYFPAHHNELYKWEAVEHFQKNWDIDASDFGEMFTEATAKTDNLLASNYSFPRGMMQGFIEADSEMVREMFRSLYDEETDLATRVKDFMEAAEKMRSKYDDGTWKNHFQNTNAISTYLWLRFPDKYYIYKYELFKSNAKELSSDYMPKRDGSVASMIGGFHMYDEICEAIKQDPDVSSMLRDAYTPSCYPDPEMKTATIDVGFYMARYFSKENVAESVIQASNDFSINTGSVNTWLLSYNPRVYDWETEEPDYNFDTMLKKVSEKRGFVIEWRSLSKKTKVGDRFVIVRLGVEPKGIMATGYVTRGGAAQEVDRQGNELASNVIEICITDAIDYRTDPLISLDLLNKKFPKQIWNPQGSGISVDPEAAKWLLENWDSLANRGQSKSSSRRYWIYSPGERAAYWQAFYEEGIMAVGWDELGDLNAYSSREDMRKKLQELHESSGSFSNDSLANWQFVHDMQPGDIVFVKRGTYYLVGCGVVMSDYIYDPSRESYQHIRKVKWTHSGEWEHPGKAVMKTLTDISQYSDYVSHLLEIFGLGEGNDTATEKREPYNKEKFLDAVFMSSDQYDDLCALLKNKMNIILQGAPGVGKTFAANKLAYSIMGEVNDSRIEMVQFHQNYTYEDFVIGYRPDGSDFVLKEGVFFRFCQKAAKDPDNKYFFIIDEINRGNMSKIFGELLMMIEKDYRDRKTVLAYGARTLSVPKNLYIIGMMNTADRSLAMIDYALRRRFSFFEMSPGFKTDGFIKYQKGIGNSKLDEVIDVICDLNQAIISDKTLGKGFCIGHSYFCNLDDCSNDRLKTIVKYEIIPMLEEYWFDDENKLKHWSSTLLGMFNE